jgi:hypothetical protein
MRQKRNVDSAWSFLCTSILSMNHNPRRDCSYDAEELEQILPFKDGFIKATTIPERMLILRSQILPAMFNYWAANGKEPNDAEESKARAKVRCSSYNGLGNI